MFGEEAAEERPEDARHAEDRAEEPLVLAAFARCDEVADDGHRQHHEPAAAESLEGAEADQQGMFWATPQSAEPIRKITIAVWKSFLRPYWSPSLPHSGVAAVAASR